MSIEYYNRNTEKYYERTIDIDMSDLYELFLGHMPNKGHILDAGCGVGRDTKHFLTLGYDVTAIDASEAMVELSSRLTGQRSHHITFQDLPFENTFDGIWASASLLHVPHRDMRHVFRKFISALKDDGIWYLSFKVGKGERIQGDGRIFSDFDELDFRDFISAYDEYIEIVNIFSGQTTKANCLPEHWLNILLHKVKSCPTDPTVHLRDFAETGTSAKH